MKRLSLCAIIAAALLFCGCMGATAVDQYGYVVVIGVDEGRAKDYLVTFMLQEENSAGESQASQGGSAIMSVEADNLIQAMSAMYSSTPFELNLSRTSAIVFSDRLAKRGDVETFLELSWSSMRLRHSIKLIVSLCSASDFIAGMQYEGKPNLTKLQYSFLEKYTEEGLTAAVNHAVFSQGAISGCFDSAATLGRVDESAPDVEAGSVSDETTAGVERSGGMAAYAVGAALFDGWKMTGVLNDRETMLLLLSTGEFENGHIYVEDGENMLVIALKRSGKPQVELTLDGKPHAIMRLELRCEVEQDPSGTAKLRWEEEVRARVERQLDEQLLELFEHCRSMNSDAMGFGKYAVMQFTDTDAWEAFDWKRAYPSLTAEFSVTATLNGEEMEAYRE